MKCSKLFLFLGAIFLCCSCTFSHVAGISDESTAYIVHGTKFKTRMYYCDASDGVPECWQVEEMVR